MFAPFNRIIRLTIIVAIVAFPALGIIQWIAPEQVKPFDEYIDFLSYIWKYVYEWGDWGIVVFLSYLFTKSTKTYYDTAEKIRYNRLVAEIERWGRTPYIAPLHYFYLISPPPSYSSYIKDVAENPFYQQVVDFFRNRVYIDAAFTSGEPGPKPTRVKVIGTATISSVAVGLLLVAGFFALLYKFKTPETWFMGYEKFTIPFLAFLLSWIIQQIYAIIVVSNTNTLGKRMLEVFGEPEPRILWRDVFPDRRGEIILKAWKAEREKKQRYFYYLKNKPVPAEEQFVYDNPALAPYPFPSFAIPEWANEMEESVYERVDRWRDNKINKEGEIIKKSNGQVVPLHKRKKEL